MGRLQGVERVAIDRRASENRPELILCADSVEDVHTLIR
jgi:hypothetical protein